MSSTHTFPVNIVNLEGEETMLARDKGNFHAQGKNRTRDPPVQWLERPIKHVVFGGIRRVVSSILALGRKIFVVPGEHDFSSFQVENVHW